MQRNMVALFNPMKNKVPSNNKLASVTPSTLKLNQLREGKGYGMLTAEEVDLLRKSKKEIADVCRSVRESKY